MITTIPVHFEVDPHFCVAFDEDPHFHVDFENLTILERDTDIYTGDTVITPSDSVQILATENKKLMTGIQINPIPANYGKVSWDGFRLRVE